MGEEGTVRRTVSHCRSQPTHPPTLMKLSIPGEGWQHGRHFPKRFRLRVRYKSRLHEKFGEVITSLVPEEVFRHPSTPRWNCQDVSPTFRGPLGVSCKVGFRHHHGRSVGIWGPSPLFTLRSRVVMCWVGTAQ